MAKLEDLREWLLLQIDGSEETRGDDGLISGFIRQIDALPSETGPIPQSKTQAKRFAAQMVEPRGCPTPGACSAVEELSDLKQRLLPQFAGRAERAEHERDEMHKKLIEAINRALEVAARVADEMTRDVSGGSNVGKAIRNLKVST